MKYINAKRVELIIVHDYNETSGECTPGEEVIGIILIYRGKRYWIPLGPTHLILIDLLCRRAQYCARDAVWIAAQMQLDPFVIYHGTNAPGHVGRPARTSRTAVRQQIKRTRDTFAELIKEEGLDLNVLDIIRSEESSTNVVRYRINVDVRWVHRSDPEVLDAACVPNKPPVHPGTLGFSAPLSNGARV